MYSVVLVTTKNGIQANKIAKALLKEKLIACANIVNNVKSLFWWEGKVCKEQEVLMIIKTRKSHFNKVCEKIKLLHTYNVPEIIELPIVKGNKDYLNWIKTLVR